MHHPSFTWMVQQQYVARLATVQQVSSGNPHNTWTVQRRNTVARLATIQRGSSLTMVHGWCTVHARCILQRSFVFFSRHNLLVRHALFQLGWCIPLFSFISARGDCHSDLHEC